MSTAMEAKMAKMTKKVETEVKTAVKTVSSNDTSKQVAALDKLALTGGYNTQWTAAWNAYKEAAGL